MFQKTKTLLAVLVLLALAALACNLSGDSAPAAAPASVLPTVNIQVPVNGMSFVEGANVVIQVVGTDAGAGISRIDLQIDDLPAGTSTAPVSAGQNVYIATFEWPAAGQGAHAISAVALRADGTASAPALISVNVVAAPATPVPPTDIPPTEAPPTEAPPEESQAEQPPAEEPTEEEPTGPSAVTSAGINVRSGPGTNYAAIGSLLAGTEMELTGRNADSTWLRAPYALSEGWFFAGLLNVSGDVSTLPVINVAPPPATATPIPPTAIPATAAPVATAVPAGPSISYRSTIEDGVTYDEGTCFTFFWETSGVKAVYFEGDAKTGSGSEQRCPDGTGTKSFTLRVILNDDSEREQTYYVTLD